MANSAMAQPQIGPAMPHEREQNGIFLPTWLIVLVAILVTILVTMWATSNNRRPPNYDQYPGMIQKPNKLDRYSSHSHEKERKDKNFEYDDWFWRVSAVKQEATSTLNTTNLALVLTAGLVVVAICSHVYLNSRQIDLKGQRMQLNVTMETEKLKNKTELRKIIAGSVTDMANQMIPSMVKSWLGQKSERKDGDKDIKEITDFTNSESNAIKDCLSKNDAILDK